MLLLLLLFFEEAVYGALRLRSDRQVEVSLQRRHPVARIQVCIELGFLILLEIDSTLFEEFAASFVVEIALIISLVVRFAILVP